MCKRVFLTAILLCAAVLLLFMPPAAYAQAPILTITSPAGPDTYASGDPMTVGWTSDQALSTGEFGVWVRSSSDTWYIGQVVPATGGTSFSTPITLSLPTGSGYQVIVAYRPTSGSGTWGSWATSWWSFAVSSGLPYLTITSPAGPDTYASGDPMTVGWTSDQALSTGEFGVWVRSSSDTWYIGQVVPATGGTSFSTPITLSLPTGSGYQVIVAYRPTSGSGTWGSFVSTWWSFTVTATMPAITFGQTLAGSITTPAEMDTYTFAANAGDRVLVRMSFSSGDFWMGVRIYGPDGTELAEQYSPVTAEIADCQLPTTGTYSIVAYDGFEGTGTGEYYLYLQRL